MAGTDGLPPFAVAQINEVVILTALIEDLSVKNASWFKDHVLEFVRRYRPPSLVINLANVQSIDRLGIGLMITLNTQLKSQLSLYFTQLSWSLEQQLENMYLRHAFKVLDPHEPEKVFGPVDDAAREDWHAKLQQFIFSDREVRFDDIPQLSDLPGYQPEFEGQENHEPSIEDIVAAFENDPRYRALEQARQRKIFWRKWRHYTFTALISTGFVLGSLFIIFMGVNSRWSTLLDQAKTTMKKPNIDHSVERKMEYHEIIERFDKDGDGFFTQEDWVYLSSGEKLELINHGFHDRRENNLSPFNFFKR